MMGPLAVPGVRLADGAAALHTDRGAINRFACSATGSAKRFIPTRCSYLRLKRICLVNMISAILIILTIHIIIAIRWMLIKILSAVINDWERNKVIVSGGCCPPFPCGTYIYAHQNKEEPEAD